MASLVLGGIVFRSFEIPERIEGLGSRQQLAVHKLVGGTRVVDAMGPDPHDVRWAGRMQGGDAVGRCRQINALAESGAQTFFAWGGIAKLVVVEDFDFVAERTYQCLYHIELKVVSNAGASAAAGSGLGFPILGANDPSIAPVTLDGAVAGDLAAAQVSAQASYAPGGV